MKRLLLALAIFACAGNAGAQNGKVEVKAWEGTIDMPTYLLDDPEEAPIFERDWSYQRARRSVYPYLLNDNMTRQKETVTYKALYMENEYVELCVLPEIGGRLIYAVDKTNGYDIFYHNHVIKPANVGMLGAWVSGGVEWNVFHHHRATTHTPCDYRIECNADGGKTIWVGETEYRHRMSWAIGITLHPGKSYMEITGRLMNSTMDNNSMLYWSNVSTLVDENYQIIFPQSVEFATFHCKNWMAHWPITHEPFNGMDFYKNGIDASWWKNHYMSNSMFVYDLKEDFIAGYDHGRHAGTMLTGNHNIIKGGKFWLWGPNSEWDTKILTDNSGHYCELMAGAYSDNQPDYNWSAPYETKEFSQYWYGIRDMEGVKAGDRHAAINMDVLDGSKVLVGVNTTEPMKALRVVLRSADGAEVWSATSDVAPDKPFVNTVKLDKGIDTKALTMTLEDASGKTMLTYRPVVKDPNKPLPAIVERPKLPKEIENTEECYLVGLRNLQFHNPFIDPTDYFNEVLRRDPGDTRANTRMGVWYRQRGEYDKAAAYLRKALVRLTHDYTRPMDCEAMYNLGLILKIQGKTEAAVDTLYRDVWNYTYNSAANYQLAQIYSSAKDFDMALERLDEAVTYNGRNFEALDLKASILRELGRKDDALACVDRVLAEDPLNSYAVSERDMLCGTDSLKVLMRDEVESYIELALKYMHNGFEAKSVELLKYADSIKPYPTVKMWLGWFADKAGDKATVGQYFKDALALPTKYCNPFRLETIDVLNLAMKYCPESAKPHYYLGNLLYDKQKDNAIAQWKKCVEMDPSNAMAWRNLGWANWLYTKNYAEAAKYYEKAVELAPDNALFLEEIDQVYEAGGFDVRKRFELLKSHHTTCVKRYYPLAAEVITGTFVGEYDYVLNLLRTCYFPTREGVANFHDVYVDALILAGQKKLAEGNSKEALALFNEAFEYPVNHQVFLVDERTPRDAQIWWNIAKAYESAGQRSKAMAAYKKAAAVDDKGTDYRYWKGLALSKLGKSAEAKALFDGLVESGKSGVVTEFVNFYGAEGTTGSTVEGINTKAYYTMGLGYLGLGETSEAKKCFEESVRLKIDNLWPNVMLKDLK